ncbi:hypothetical protein GALMADRAFT_208731 [Galerina marginata CBS 339.88]|uniref:DUF300-domain-containing protein n=1 Tax=Galerina marginata (strain CBS 339.88) TaxID=685588 RepID=A0A067THC8_GALM3|nr:hypothetical protein GALMADRAFT_208731 [Galerina marginata CBS 339.88]
MAGSGAGSRLPTPVLVLAGLSTLVAVLVSMMSIFLQLRNYRKPALQRMVVRIMVMVPLYAISSLISLFSVEAAFVIDAIRDIYEAFVIYCFFVLLLSYLGGERSLLILLHGRPPKDPVFPINLFKREIDVSDPYTFLFLKRGILQYVQIKPLLAATTLILKAVGKYNEGDFRANSGYLYVSIVYNISICLSLYCLAMFWVCVNDDLKPFRPVPKFLCVKGILFFSFWQSIGISTLVAARVITKLGPYTDSEHVSVALTDLLICIEMPLFAIAHNYAFSYRDFIDPFHGFTFVARMPMYYAFRDAFGLLDVVEDTRTTLRGEGMDYREFEPAEGVMHQGLGRERRIKAGLRYSKGGRGKYWLPKAQEDTRPPGRAERVVNNAIKRVVGADEGEGVHAPLLERDAEDVVHLAPDLQDASEDTIWGSNHDDDDDLDGYGLPFGEPDEADDALFAHSRQYLFGDYNYPCIDVSSESARGFIWAEEERVLRDERGAWFSPIRGAKGQAAMRSRDREGPVWAGYGAVGVGNGNGSLQRNGSGKGSSREQGRFYDDLPEQRDERLVDHDHVRSAVAAEPKDVIMKWTNTRKHQTGSQSRAQSHSNVNSLSPSPYMRSISHPSARHTPPSSPAASGSGSGSRSGGGSPILTTRIRSPPSLSRANSRNTPSGSPVHPLPPDAVDLVVEDPHAAEEDQTRERRKGEPAMKGSGLRRVYRRGFVVHGEGDDGEEEEEGEARGEVEVEEREEGRDHGARRVDVGEEIAHVVGDDDDDANEESGGDRTRDAGSGWTSTVPVEEVIVARTTTPPLHARVQTPLYDDIPDDHNPWAS